VLTDPEGRPVAVRVVPGSTADPVAFTEIVGEIPPRLASPTWYWWVIAA